MNYAHMARELEEVAAAIERKPSFDRDLVDRLRNIAQVLRDDDPFAPRSGNG